MRLRILSFLLVLMALLAACGEAGVPPTVPPITIVITAVDDTTALADGVSQALTATAQQHIYATETVLALGGISPTPSPTLTATRTLPPEPTRFMTPTLTFTPSVTPTATFAPFLTSTPLAAPVSDSGWVRVIHAWRDTDRTGFDVLVNGERTNRAVFLGDETTFQQVAPGAVQINLQPLQPSSVFPLSQVVNVPAGGIVSVLITSQGDVPTLVPITDGNAPLASGWARLVIVQSNPLLPTVNMLMPNLERSLAKNVTSGQVLGPFDISSGPDRLIDLYDAERPEQYLASLTPFELSNRLSYILVLLPPTGDRFTDFLLIPGVTRRLPTDVGVRFINLAYRSGPVGVFLDDLPQFQPLASGAVSEGVPISAEGAVLSVTTTTAGEVARTTMGPWPDDRADKIVILYDTPPDPETGAASAVPVSVRVFSQNAPSSVINANVRLIHALPDTIPLSLELRPIRIITAPNAQGTQVVRPMNETELPWLPAGEVAFGEASAYVGRTPDVVDMRVVLSGTRNVIANLGGIQLQAGGVYDIVAVPGSDPGSVRIALIQPSAQITTLFFGQDNPTAVIEAVEATLTAMVTQGATATPTRAATPTPTWTPIATNTPRPSNTPSLPLPEVTVDPAPPNTTTGPFTLFGRYFAPDSSYTITINGSTRQIAFGRTNPDGWIIQELTVPSDLAPGPQVIRVCVDCRVRGANQEVFVVVNLAAPDVTPTATPQP